MTINQVQAEDSGNSGNKSTLSEQEELNRRDQEEAARRFDEARKAVIATSTRPTGLSDQQDYQDLQDSQDFQDKQDSQDSRARASLDLGNDSGLGKKAVKENQYAELFRKGNYGAISEEKFLFLAWQASEGRDWQNDGTSETWEFCRYLCAHPKFPSLKPAALVRKVRRLIGLEEECLETILAEISRVRFAKGRGPLDWAIAMAAQYSVKDPDDLGLERYNRFLSIAGWLQVLRGSATVYLPVEKLAAILNVSPRAVSTWRTMAKDQGLLTETSRYVLGKKATEFRFDVERFGVFRERQNL